MSKSIIDEANPCKECKGIKFYKVTHTCISCTARKRRLKSIVDGVIRNNETRTKSEHFKARESFIMKDVWYL